MLKNHSLASSLKKKLLCLCFFFFSLTSLTELSAQLFFITYLKDFLEKPQPNYFVSLTSDILIEFPSEI